MASVALDLTVLRKGRKVADFLAEADPSDTKKLRALLADAVKRDGYDVRDIGDYEMEIRLHNSRSLITNFVATAE